MNSNKKIAENQPLPDALRPELPVNYFLLVGQAAGKKDFTVLTVESDFHETDSYLITPFYKSISNIL